VKVFVTSEHRFWRTPDGKIWTAGNPSYEFWTRYLSVFDEVVVVARVQSVTEQCLGWKMVQGPGVNVLALPGYRGPSEFVRTLPRVRATLMRLATEGGGVVLRLPGPVSSLFRRYAVPRGYPFGVELVGDPWDVFSPGAIKHYLRPLFRQLGVSICRSECRSAVAVAYVSERQLKGRYPAADGAFTTAYSSIALDADHFAPRARTYSEDMTYCKKIIMVGSLEHGYKGVDVLLTAMRDVVDRIPDSSLTIVGDGIYRASLERQAELLGIADRVRFLGHLPAGEQVRRQLDQAALFVLPSRAEGLPRAMIEAMARALPCIGTKVGGIPELLPEEDMVPRDDAAALAEAIVSVLSDAQRMSMMSARNLQVAQAYRSDILQERRKAFYWEVRRRTEEWLSARAVRDSARFAFQPKETTRE